MRPNEWEVVEKRKGKIIPDTRRKMWDGEWAASDTATSGEMRIRRISKTL